MNQIFKVKFNHHTGVFAVVSELMTNRKKKAEKATVVVAGLLAALTAGTALANNVEGTGNTIDPTATDVNVYGDNNTATKIKNTTIVGDSNKVEEPDDPYTVDGLTILGDRNVVKKVAVNDVPGGKFANVNIIGRNNTVGMDSPFSTVIGYNNHIESSVKNNNSGGALKDKGNQGHFILIGNEVGTAAKPVEMGLHSVAIGDNIKDHLGTGAIAIGEGTRSGYWNSIAIGKGAKTGTETPDIAFNWDPYPLAGANSIAIGNDAESQAWMSIAIGYQARADHIMGAQNSYSNMALGYRARALGAQNVAIGARAFTDDKGADNRSAGKLKLEDAYRGAAEETRIGKLWLAPVDSEMNAQYRTPYGVVSVGLTDPTGMSVFGENGTNLRLRRIQGIAPGLIAPKSTDAVTGAQMYGLSKVVDDLTKPLKVTGENNTTPVTGFDLTADKHLKLKTDSNIGLTLTAGQGTEADPHKVELKLNEDLSVGSLEVGNTAAGANKVKLSVDAEGNLTTDDGKGLKITDGTDAASVNKDAIKVADAGDTTSSEMKKDGIHTKSPTAKSDLTADSLTFADNAGANPKSVLNKEGLTLTGATGKEVGVGLNDAAEALLLKGKNILFGNAAAVDRGDHTLADGAFTDADKTLAFADGKALSLPNLPAGNAAPNGVMNLDNRRIQGLAAGKISAASTDAINGSQLFNVAQALTEQLTSSTRPMHWSGSNNGTAVTGFDVGADSSVQVVTDQNLKLDMTAAATGSTDPNKINLALNPDLSVGTLEVGNTGQADDKKVKLSVNDEGNLTTDDGKGLQVKDAATGDTTDVAKDGIKVADAAGTTVSEMKKDGIHTKKPGAQSDLTAESLTFGGDAGADPKSVLDKDGLTLTGAGGKTAGIALNDQEDALVLKGKNILFGNATAPLAQGTAGTGAHTYTELTLSNGKTLAVDAPAGNTQPNGVVNFDNRRLQGVAAGLVAADSTDAVNGSQLYGVAKGLKDDLTAQLEAAGIGENQIDPTSSANTVLGKDNTLNPKDGTPATGNTVTGKDQTITGSDNTVAGNTNTVDGTKNVVSGKGNTTTGEKNVAQGVDTTTEGDSNVVIGDRAKAVGNNNVALGTEASTVKPDGSAVNDALAFGNGAKSEADGAIALGKGAKATDPNSVAIGSGSVAGASIQLGDATANQVGVVSFGKPAENGQPAEVRLVTGLANGTVAKGSTDAVTGDQLFEATRPMTLTDGTNNMSLSGGSTVKVTTDTNLTVSVDSTAGEVNLALNPELTLQKLTLKGAGAADPGVDLVTDAAGTLTVGADNVALGTGATVTTPTALTDTTVAGVGGTVALNAADMAGNPAAGAVSVGSAGNERRLQNVAAGMISQTSTDAVNGSQLYALAKVVADIPTLRLDAEKNLNVGGTVDPTSKNATALGSNALVKGDGAVALGADSKAEGDNALALGKAAEASGTGVALGGNTQAADGNVALGFGSSAPARDDLAQGVVGVVSVGNAAAGETRILSGVADGTRPTDAVNVRQLEAYGKGINERFSKFERETRGGIAAANAIASLPQVVYAGTSSVAVGLGDYEGRQALAVGISHMTNDGEYIWRVNGAVSTDGKRSLGAGVAYVW